MLAAMFAALMSSLTSQFNGTSSMFTMDIWKHIRPKVNYIATIRQLQNEKDLLIDLHKHEQKNSSIQFLIFDIHPNKWTDVFLLLGKWKRSGNRWKNIWSCYDWFEHSLVAYFTSNARVSTMGLSTVYFFIYYTSVGSGLFAWNVLEEMYWAGISWISF